MLQEDKTFEFNDSSKTAFNELERRLCQNPVLKIYNPEFSFQKTMSKKELIPRIARWALFLEDFHYLIVHRQGMRMKHVDALSRNAIMMVNKESINSKIKKLQQEDTEIKVITEILKDRPYKDFCIRDGLVYKFVDGRELLVVPRVLQN